MLKNRASVNFYQTTRRNNPEDSHLHTRRREILKWRITIVEQYHQPQIIKYDILSLNISAILSDILSLIFTKHQILKL
jgi:hypothetical protein